MSSIPTRPFYELNWEDPWSPLFGSPIEIPSYTILWRGYDLAYPAISSHPSYYSSQEVAFGYAELIGRELGAFYSTRPLRVLDVRQMKTLLSQMIQMNPDDPFATDWICPMLSFGICSLRHQIDLYKSVYRQTLQDPSHFISKALESIRAHFNPNSVVEQVGIRVGETGIDGRTMIILQEIFRGHIDGFISQRTSSPFHIEKDQMMSPELILFSPKDCQLRQQHRYLERIQLPNMIIDGLKVITISSILEHRYELLDLSHVHGKNVARMMFYMKGGRDVQTTIPSTPHPLDLYDDLRNRGRTKKMDRYAKQIGKRLCSKIKLMKYEAPVYTVPHGWM